MLLTNKRVLSFSVIFIVLLSGCRSLTLLHKNIEHPIPSKAEMQETYTKNSSVYDSIALLAFALADHPLIKENSISQVTVCNENANLSRSAPAKDMKYDLIEVKTALDKDSVYNTIIKSIQRHKKAIKIPDCIDIFPDRTWIPYKKIKETIKGDYYKLFIYVRNGEAVPGDSIAHNIGTN